MAFEKASIPGMMNVTSAAFPSLTVEPLTRFSD